MRADARWGKGRARWALGWNERMRGDVDKRERNIGGDIREKRARMGAVSLQAFVQGMKGKRELNDFTLMLAKIVTLKLLGRTITLSLHER